MGPVAMATYCLLGLWLVEHANWYATHCFKVHGAVCSKSQKCNWNFPRVKTLYRASTLGTLELRFETSSKLHHKPWYNWKILEVTLILVRNGVYSNTPWRRTSKSKNPENLTSTSLEKNITAALTVSKNTENLTSLEDTLTEKKAYESPKAYGGWRWRFSAFTNLYVEEIFAKCPCRK